MSYTYRDKRDSAYVGLPDTHRIPKRQKHHHWTGYLSRRVKQGQAQPRYPKRRSAAPRKGVRHLL